MEYKGYRLNNLYKEAENDIIDDLKEEVNYLKRKIKEYKGREEYFENEMDIVTNESKGFKRDLEKAKKELIDTKETLKEIEQMENEEISELEFKYKFTSENLAKKEEIEKEYSRGKSISEKVIYTLKEENKNLEVEMKKIKEEKEASERDFEYVVTNTKNDVKKIEEEKINLENKIEELLQVIKEKEYYSKEIMNENKEIKNDMEIMQIERKSIDKVKSQVSLLEEIQSIAKSFSCKICNEYFVDEHDLTNHVKKCHQKEHLEQLVSNLEMEISNRRTYFMKHIFELRENDIHKKYSCNSSCRPGCRIFHQKHNWVRSTSEEMQDKFNNIRNIEKRTCHLCDKTFARTSDFKMHIKTNHVIDDCENFTDKVSKATHILEHEKDECPEEIIEHDFLKKLSGFKATETELLKNPANSELSTKTCNVCLSSFQSKNELTEHIQAKHKENVRPFILKKL